MFRQFCEEPNEKLLASDPNNAALPSDHVLSYVDHSHDCFASLAHSLTHSLHRGTSQKLLTRKITREHFLQGVRSLGLQVTDEQILSMFSQLDRDNSGDIDFIEWIEQMQPDNPNSLPFFSSSILRDNQLLLPALTESEIKQMMAMFKRLDMLATKAAEDRVRLMVDAEHTYFQPAIDHFALHLQRKFNKTFPVIYTTYQCYLVDSYSRVILDQERAKRYFVISHSLYHSLCHSITHLLTRLLISQKERDGGLLLRSFEVPTWYKNASVQLTSDTWIPFLQQRRIQTINSTRYTRSFTQKNDHFHTPIASYQHYYFDHSLLLLWVVVVVDC